jgi:hypothetical protein
MSFWDYMLKRRRHKSDYKLLIRYEDGRYCIIRLADYEDKCRVMSSADFETHTLSFVDGKGNVIDNPKITRS